jgi:hypothetical protein
MRTCTPLQQPRLTLHDEPFMQQSRPPIPPNSEIDAHNQSQAWAFPAQCKQSYHLSPQGGKWSGKADFAGTRDRTLIPDLPPTRRG